MRFVSRLGSEPCRRTQRPTITGSVNGMPTFKMPGAASIAGGTGKVCCKAAPPSLTRSSTWFSSLRRPLIMNACRGPHRHKRIELPVDRDDLLLLAELDVLEEKEAFRRR